MRAADEAVPAMASYHCKKCGKTVKHESGKRWIKSWCEVTGQTTRLWRTESGA